MRKPFFNAAGVVILPGSRPDTWRVRLAVAPSVDVRFGIGWGEVTLLDEATGIQDGPGWWSAREAIEWTAEAQRQPGLALVRTTFRTADPAAGRAA